MATQEISSEKFQLLSATYHSPTNEPFTHAQRLPAPSSTKPTDRTKYLSALRKATAEMQEAINRELTARMEEDNDKAGENGAANEAKSKGVDEAKEEDNYGEEAVEDGD
jgi:hypothetical protein